MTIFDPARGRVIDGGGGTGSGGLLRLIGLGVAAFLLIILLFNSITRVAEECCPKHQSWECA